MVGGRVSMMSGGASSLGGAEELVRAVGCRIGMDKEHSELIDEICLNMKKEFVIEDWQLSALDSFQWQSLGAPIGLAAAVRTLATASTPKQQLATPVTAAPTSDFPSMISSSSALTDTGARKGRSSLASSIRSASGARASVQDMHADIETVDEEKAFPLDYNTADNDNKDQATRSNEKCKSGVEEWTGDNPPVCPTTLTRSLQTYTKKKRGLLCSMFFSGRSFPMTSVFQKALIHSKSGADLKAHTVFVMELNVLAAALFFGAGVELWGSFPMDAVMETPDDPNQPYVPRILALIYHFLSCANLIIQLVCTAGWIWSIHATAAVSPNKFHEFFVQTRYALDNFLLFAECAQVLLVLSITLLLGAQIAASTSNDIIRSVGYYAPIIFLFLGCKFVHTMSSYVGRVAYHGLLLMDDDPEEVGIPSEDNYEVNKDGSAAKAEFEIVKHFNRHNVTCEDSVLDVYQKTMATSRTHDNTMGFSMFDVIFPGSKPTPKPPEEQMETHQEK